jgi:thiopeptide-type bacteriocin biosynthesis protein
MYVKLYLPKERDDETLAELVRPIVLGSAAKPFDYFFFIRYMDPGFHLRIRFFGSRSAIFGRPRAHVLELLNAGVERLRSRAPGGEFILKHDRYRPERKRYGGPLGTRFSERLFAASSRAVMDFAALKRENPHYSKASKVEFAIASAEAMLDAIGMDLATRQRTFQKLRLGDPAPEVVALENTIRAAFEPRILRMLDGPRQYWKDGELRGIIDRLYDDLAPLRAGLQEIEPRLSLPIPVLANSYYHMHLNRLALYPTEEFVIRRMRTAAAGETS